MWRIYKHSLHPSAFCRPPTLSPLVYPSSKNQNPSRPGALCPFILALTDSGFCQEELFRCEKFFLILYFHYGNIAVLEAQNAGGA